MKIYFKDTTKELRCIEMEHNHVSVLENQKNIKRYIQKNAGITVLSPVFGVVE